MACSSRPAHVDLITGAQTAAAVIQKFTANAATALPLLNPRKLIGLPESHLAERASLDTMYWNMLINGKPRSSPVYLPRPAHPFANLMKFQTKFCIPREYLNTWNERDGVKWIPLDDDWDDDWD